MTRGIILTCIVISWLTTTPLHGVAIPVEYRQTSWLPEANPTPLPIAIATPTTGHRTVAQSLFVGRLPTQTFTTDEAFTLDKIWIKYSNLQVQSDQHTTRLMLFEVADAHGTSIPANPTDLFSEPQTHQFPRSTFNNAMENYAAFDVENIELKANTSYAFQFVTTGTSDVNYPYQWFSFGNDTAHEYGTFYRADRPASMQKLGFDQVFAIQFLPPPPPPTVPEPQLPPVGSPAVVPEPATLALSLLAMATLGIAGRHGRNRSSALRRDDPA